MNDQSKTPDQPATPEQPDHDPQAASGSRWEPAADKQAVAPETAGPIPYDPVPGYVPATESETRPSTGRLRTRLGLAAAAVGLVALGGAGGFAIGHATDHPNGDFGQQSGFPGDDGRPQFGGPRDHDSFERDGQGQAPGSAEGSGTDT